MTKRDPDDWVLLWRYARPIFVGWAIGMIVAYVVVAVLKLAHM